MRPIATERDSGNSAGMRNPELLPVFCVAIAIELAHLRWIVLTRWKCRSCEAPHLHCACKPAWLKKLL